MEEVARNQDTGTAAAGHGDCERETENTSPCPCEMGGVLQRTYGDSSLCSSGTDWAYGGQGKSRKVGEGAAALAQRSQPVLTECLLCGREDVTGDAGDGEFDFPHQDESLLHKTLHTSVYSL